MKSAAILTPPSTGLSGILLSGQNPKFPKDQDTKKIDALGRSFTYFTQKQRQLFRPDLSL